MISERMSKNESRRQDAKVKDWQKTHHTSVELFSRNLAAQAVLVYLKSINEGGEHWVIPEHLRQLPK